MDPEQKKELPEEQFIQERYRQDPNTLYNWLFFLAFVLALLWGAGSWYAGYLHTQQLARPFLQVTNRALSLFLWQHPEYMRIHAKSKNGYLPAFQYLGKVTVEPALADQYAIAPPELLFRYHTWDRLIGKEWVPRPIPASEFLEFLEADEEWQPAHWPAAPQAYQDLLAGLTKESTLDLRELSEGTLPLQVRIAFQGWKNFMKEGKEIDAFRPTYAEVNQFLMQHPRYARNFWQNIEDRDGLHYLKRLSENKQSADFIPNEELAPFLKLALFNSQAKS